MSDIPWPTLPEGGGRRVSDIPPYGGLRLSSLFGCLATDCLLLLEKTSAGTLIAA